MALNPALMNLVKNQKAKYSYSNAKTVKLKEGKTKIRILPNPDNELGKFWADLGVHWIKTEKDGKPVAVVGCEEHVHEKPCAICNAIDKASKSAPDDATLEIIKEWKVKKSVLVNALVRSGDTKSEDPVILELPVTAFGNILSMIDEYGTDSDPLSLTDGIDFVIERVGKGKDTKYTVMPAMKSAPVSEDSMKKRHDLEEFIKREFFRGEEQKALNAIASVTGVVVGAPALTGPKGGNAALLTSAKVEDAELAELEDELATAPAPATKPAAATTTKAAKPAPAPAPEPEEDEFGTALPAGEIDDLLGDLDNI
jgi:hypothetical protein